MTPGRKAKHDGIGSEVTVEADKVTLGGTLALPDKAAGIVLFAHGSGSSPESAEPLRRTSAPVEGRRDSTIRPFDRRGRID